ncbi:MAG: hypothetical protein VR69_07405 [Peptococcaceae bacterium BRH_c4b]|nr:MAG: hypothetical protein VR69_07405 [Peptococcaceae bacterium BRH_c4b]
MNIIDIMNREFTPLKPYDNLQKAARLFRQFKQDGLPVIGDDGKLMGFMSKADLYDAVASGFSPDTPITDIFTRNVVTIHESISYEEMAGFVHTSHVGHALMVNDSYEVVGIFNKAEWIMAMLKEGAKLISKLQMIIETMHNGLIVVDCQGFVISINRAAEKIFNTMSSSATGKPLEAFLPGIRLDQIFMTGKSEIGVKRTIGRISLLCNITSIVVEGRTNGAIISFQDLNDLNNIVVSGVGSNY